ncbi:MAG TPA: hypothetical protein VLE99_05970 [Candidatus Saccharimonadales bacterium]|nr:hypothetical protein [Candidatus Saccharimonadales bacterium]
MWLRSTIEQQLPVREGESKLSERARRLVFRGSYWLPGTSMVRVEADRNYSSATRDNFPYGLNVVRQRFDRTRYSTEFGLYDRVYDEPTSGVADEMRQPGMLERASRVESIARRIKLTTLSALAAVGLAAAWLSGPSPASTEPQGARVGIEQYHGMVPGTEAIPVGAVQAEQLHGIGQMAITSYEMVEV